MTALRNLPFVALLLFCLSELHPTAAVSSAQTRSADRERERAYVRQSFQKNFKQIQLLSQKLLQDHETGLVTGERLGKDARSIHKAARALRSLMALGEMAQVKDVPRAIDTPQKFDESIRQLSKLIWDFAHNPIHQNSKVFNTNLARQAQTDLLSIINLSKALGDKSKGYAVSATRGN
ncbi:MAG: hypothetical protein SF339_21920 [Blastocatellia bacterium]|nr:hypothetical protein [Blastocatellia bacterium]